MVRQERLSSQNTAYGSMAGRSDAGVESVVLEQTSVLFARRQGPPRTRHAYEVRTALRAKQGRFAWTALDIGFLGVLFTIFILNMLDITITLIHIGNVGWIAEGNPIIRVIAERGAAGLAVLFKVVIILGSMWIMWHLYRQTQIAMATARGADARRRAVFVFRSQLVATGVLLALYTWIIQNNVRIAWL